MLSLRFLILICALATGIYGFSPDAPASWTFSKTSFVVLLLVAAVSFVGSELRRPSLLWEVVDEFHNRRLRGLRIQQRRSARLG